MPDLKNPLTLICKSCLSADPEPLDEFTCSWCGGQMVELFRLPHDEQERVWTQMVLC